MTGSRAKNLRNRPTEAEKVLWQRLRGKQLSGYRFRRQAPIGQFIVDFACFHPRLVIEIDGGQHTQIEQHTRDLARTAWLEREGFRVARFWNHDVLQQTDSVVADNLHTLGELSPD